MRSILEKAIVHLLNDESDKAENMFHQFMVSRARQIHESLRQGGEAALDEGWDEEIKEEYFTEDDLSDETIDDEADADAEDADLDAENADVDAVEADADADLDTAEDDLDGDDLDGDDDLGDDDDMFGDDASGGDESSELGDRLSDVEDRIAEFAAEFEQKMAELGDGVGDDVDGEDASLGIDDMADEDDGLDGETGVDEFGDAGATDLDATDFEQSSDEGAEASEDGDEDEFDLDGITESVIAELEKINVSNDDGKEVGSGGKKLDMSRTSPVSGKTREQKAKPVVSKSENASGFERQTPPSYKEAKKTKYNMMSSSEVEGKPVKAGSGNALINKDFDGSGKKNDKSVID